MNIAIIGAGAAGCFAAANIPAAKSHQIVVFEKTGKILQKVKVSGGGRCNVTNACFDIEDFAEHYPRGKQFLRKTLHQFNAQDTIQWFESRGVQLKAEADGRVFPQTNDSQTIIDCIYAAMQKQGVKIALHKSVSHIDRQAEQYNIHFADGSTFLTDRILIATGGYPKQEQYAWIEALQQECVSPVPSLFTFNAPKHPITALMGLSAEVSVKIAGTKLKESGPLLITHWGFSGPAILRCSAWGARVLQEKSYHFSLLINWLKDYSDDTLREEFTEMRQQNGKQFIWHKNPFGLAKRLWEYLLQQSQIQETTRWGELPAVQQNKLLEHLLRDQYDIKGKTTFKEEFVTCGGVALKKLDAQSMQSRVHRGIFYAGEITDIDGITGGFNFQNAWTSAWIAAHAMVTLPNNQ